MPNCILYILPLYGRNDKFQSFVLNLSLKFQNSYKQLLGGLSQGTFRKSLVEKES